MHIVSALIFNLRFHADRRHGRLLVAYDHSEEHNLSCFLRMVRTWSWIDEIRAEPITDIDWTEPAPPVTNVVIISEKYEVHGASLHPSWRTITARPPVADSPIFALYQKAQNFDFELGGVNEWDESVRVQFSVPLLQLLSAVHCSRYFPHYAWPDIETAAGACSGSMRFVDLACGPISNLRWGALHYDFELTGIDPLNDVYSAIFARHGYDDSLKLRPDHLLDEEIIESGPALEPFDLVFYQGAAESQALLPTIQKTVRNGGLVLLIVPNYARGARPTIWTNGKDVFVKADTGKTVRAGQRATGLKLERIYWQTDSANAILLSKQSRTTIATRSTSATGSKPEPPFLPCPPTGGQFAHWYREKVLTTDWFTQHLARWARYLEPLRDVDCRVLEVGSWEGGSTIFFARYLRKSRITCVDTFTGGADQIEDEPTRVLIGDVQSRFDRNVGEFGDRIEKIVDISAEALGRLVGKGEKFDLIYIDASHQRDDVLADSALGWLLLAHGGIMIWDDYAWNPDFEDENRPTSAIQSFLLLHKEEFVYLHIGYQIIIRSMRCAVASNRKFRQLR